MRDGPPFRSTLALAAKQRHDGYLGGMMIITTAAYNLLAVSTLTRRPRRPDMLLSLAVAEIFESPSFELKNHHVRPMANSWANWGAAGVLDIYAAWNRALAPHAAAVSAAELSRRSSRRAAAIALAPQPRRSQRRSLRLSRLPTALAAFVVGLTA